MVVCHSIGLTAPENQCPSGYRSCALLPFTEKVAWSFRRHSVHCVLGGRPCRGQRASDTYVLESVPFSTALRSVVPFAVVISDSRCTRRYMRHALSFRSSPGVHCPRSRRASMMNSSFSQAIGVMAARVMAPTFLQVRAVHRGFVVLSVATQSECIMGQGPHHTSVVWGPCIRHHRCSVCIRRSHQASGVCVALLTGPTS